MAQRARTARAAAPARRRAARCRPSRSAARCGAPGLRAAAWRWRAPRPDVGKSRPRSAPRSSARLRASAVDGADGVVFDQSVARGQLGDGVAPAAGRRPGCATGGPGRRRPAAAARGARPARRAARRRAPSAPRRAAGSGRAMLGQQAAQRRRAPGRQRLVGQQAVEAVEAEHGVLEQRLARGGRRAGQRRARRSAASRPGRSTSSSGRPAAAHAARAVPRLAGGGRRPAGRRAGPCGGARIGEQPHQAVAMSSGAPVDGASSAAEQLGVRLPGAASSRSEPSR